MNRVPLRVRLTLPFAVAVAVVLAALGIFVYTRVGSTLLATIDGGLRSQVAEAEDHAAHGRDLLDRDALDVATVAQLLDAHGRVVSSQPLDLPRLLDRAGAARALTRSLQLSTHVHGLNGQWRLLAVPTHATPNASVLVLGRSLAQRNDTLERLRHELLIVAPAALLLATLAGWLLAGAALRPVDEMRIRARAISAETPGHRLPVPPADDELSRLATTLNEMLDRLEAALAHERRFVSDASHELRTPLALLKTELELALRRPRPKEELEAALRSAAEETDRLTRLAEDLLLIARADQGALPVRARSLNANEVLGALESRFQMRAAGTGRALVVERNGELPLEADPERLAQALGNLVDNAFEHGEGRVTVRAQHAGAQVEFHVLDEGRGVAPAFAGVAFDRFTRADDARGRGGAGLGLAIVQAVAEAHGGSAGLVNRPEGGADGWIALPTGAGDA